MDQAPNQNFLADITGAFDWWRLAGVDCDFVDEPHEWTRPPEEEVPPPSEWSIAREKNEQQAAIEAPDRLDPAALPTDLAAFTHWWMTEPLLDTAPLATRVAPAGKAGAEVMVIVEAPEAEDRETLLSGTHGRLLEAILGSVGITRDHAYIASALPRTTPVPDWEQTAALGYGPVLRHHVALVAPKRLFVLGGNALSLLGHESPQRPAVSQLFKHEESTIPLLASWGLASLLNQPRAKPVLWRAMLDWIAS